MLQRLPLPLLSLPLLCAVTTMAQPSSSSQRADREQIVIAHRGASGYLPEHTLEAYAMAHAQGADFIEPDLVLTRDGVFICRHDVQLEDTTDVAEVFPERRRSDGHWYAADLTLAEIRTLRAVERTSGRFPRNRSRFAVPTFEEMIELVQGLNRTTGRTAGIYPELKAPAWHREQGLPMEEAFLELVRRYGYRKPGAPIFVQCFESEPLRRLRQLGSELRQVMLISGDREYDELVTDGGLERIATFAVGIGPSKTRLERDPTLVSRARKHGLVVHPYTFRADDLPAKYSSLEAELQRFYGELEVDGLFTDFPDRARSWLDRRGNRESD